MKSRIWWRALSLSLLTLAALAGTAKPANAQTNHGGPVIVSAKVVFLFWGPTFNNVSSPDHTYATTLQAYRNQLGTSSFYSTLTQYCGSNGCIQLSNLGSGTPDWFDTTTPPVNVTDAKLQAEVHAYLATHAFDANTIYEVVLPSTSYSSDGGATSCGGPALAYCSYHSWIGSGLTATKYTVQPYPSCSGCSVSAWTPAQNQEHFVAHDTANTVTDPTGSTWFDSTGAEIADKCAWTPTPFLSGSYAYQYLWSNATHSCVKTR
jgi:hypothetical protein